MNTTKVVLTIILIAVIGLAAGLGVRAFMKSRNVQPQDSTDTTTTIDNGFAWGVTILPFPYSDYLPTFSQTQVAESKKLGINYIRVDYTPFNPKAIDVVVDAAKKNGLKVVLVIPFGPKDIFTNKTLEADTTLYISEIVTRYKGKVAVYQLATEVASVALANDANKHGVEAKDYPAGKLAAVTTWVKAAAAAVKATDPTAKRLVNDQWVHTGFFDNYFKAGGDFDILGWNWFSDMGNSMDVVTIDAKKRLTYQLMEKLKGYGKPIWLTEVNRRLGSQGNNEKAQADFLTTMGQYVATQPAIKGFFVFNFIEDQMAPIQERGYSIVNATNVNKVQKITGYKPAFDAYKAIIKGSR